MKTPLSPLSPGSVGSIYSGTPLEYVETSPAGDSAVRVGCYALNLGGAQPGPEDLGASIPAQGGDRDIIAVTLLQSSYRCSAELLNRSRRAYARGDGSEHREAPGSHSPHREASLGPGRAWCWDDDDSDELCADVYPESAAVARESVREAPEASTMIKILTDVVERHSHFAKSPEAMDLAYMTLGARCRFSGLDTKTLNAPAGAGNGRDVPRGSSSSAVSHSFRLMFGRAIIARSGLDASMLSLLKRARTRVEATLK